MSTHSTLASPAALRELADQLAQRTGLTGLTLSHENLLRALALSRVTENLELERILREGNMDWEALIDALTVRETYFFRHPDQFEELRRQVLPTLRALIRDPQPLRVWSAGCASGEEAYTLAIVFHSEGLADRVQILATDIAAAALERGRSGQYRDWSLRSIQPEIQEQYFRTEGGVHTIDPALRSQITWRQLNLAEPGYPSRERGIGQFPLIFCRNVLMFFDNATIAQVARRLHASLVPGGWLFLGPSDPNISVYADLEVHVAPSGLMYRRPLVASVHRRDSSLAPPPQPTAAFEPAREMSRTEPPVAKPKLQPTAAEPNASAGDVRAVWNAQGPNAALRLCQSALARAETSAELHHLHALLLWELQRYVEAASAMRRVLFLDQDNAIAHFGLAALLERQGALAAARRSYQNVLRACDGLAPDAPLPLGDGICVSGLHAAAADGLSRLKTSEAGSL